MNKFIRNYKVTIDLDAKTISQVKKGNVSIRKIIVEPPFTFEFNVIRKILRGAMNDGSFRFYNLSKEVREQIHKDRNDFNTYRGIEVRAGYQDTIPRIFKGNITYAWSAREGNNIVTTVEARDGGFARVNSQTDKDSSFPKGTSRGSVVRSLQKKFIGISPGVIGTLGGKLDSRGNTNSGQIGDLLDELTPGSFFVDLETSYVLGKGEALRGVLPVISAETGLLSTPIRERTKITFDMLFEPRLIIGQAVRLNAFTLQSDLNTDYKIISLMHNGVISEGVSGKASTTIELLYGFPIKVVN